MVDRHAAPTAPIPRIFAERPSAGAGALRRTYGLGREPTRIRALGIENERGPSCVRPR